MTLYPPTVGCSSIVEIRERMKLIQQARSQVAFLYLNNFAKTTDSKTFDNNQVLLIVI